MNDEKNTVLKIRNLTKEFKIKSGLPGSRAQVLHAVNNFSLDVYEGETLGIVGESGCGKSTLGRTLIQLIKATSGTVSYRGTDIFSLHGKKLKNLKKQMQMIFQDPYSSLDPRKTAGSLIGEPLIVHKMVSSGKEYEEKVLELMRSVGLDVQHINRYPHEFSGGQRQRINIARALSMNPALLICDEPVSALDVSIQAQILNLFNSIQKERHITYLFISHDLGVIKHVSDRIAIMYLGRLVELCNSEELYRNPLHPYTKALLSAIPPESPFEKMERIVLKGEIPSPIGDLRGCPLAGRCPYASERCSREEPALYDAGNGHKVACFLLNNNE